MSRIRPQRDSSAANLLDRYGSCLLELEQKFSTDQPLHEQLQAAAAAVGAVTAAKRVVIYGNSEPDDNAVRVRVSWSSPDQPEFEAWIDAIPLLTRRSRTQELACSAPRGRQCPSSCDELYPDCALRGTCSTAMYPLRVAGQDYGTLAAHARTGHVWTAAQRSLVRQAAYRVGLQIARARQECVQHALAAERSGIAMTVLHQTGTPVTVLNGVLQQLSERSVDAGDKRLLNIARAEGARLRRLCDDLAAIVMGGDHEQDELRWCDLVPQLKVSVLAARERHPGATISITAVGEIPNVRCDPSLLGRVIGGLIDNSVRYSRAPASIELATWCEGERVMVRLRDDGPGISAADAERLAEPFTRLDPAMRTQPGGTGLGLALAQRLARDAGNDVRIEPRTDRTGTQVTIALTSSPPPW